MKPLIYHPLIPPTPHLSSSSILESILIHRIYIPITPHVLPRSLLDIMAQEEQDFVLLEGKDVVDFNVEGLLPLSPKELQSVQNWLDPTNYNAESSEYNKHLASYANGTGQWIQNTDQYQKWLQSDGDTAGALWIKATAGAGKSVVAAHTASLLAEEGTPVLSFFFRQIIAKNRTPQSLVRDWLTQLLPYSPKLQKNLKEIIDNRRSLESVAFEELWDLATSTMFTMKRIYCVVDALDEMNCKHFPPLFLTR